MDMPIYKFWKVRYTEAWYQLSPEEQAKLSAKVEEALNQAGGKRIAFAVSLWADEHWAAFGVEQFPSLEAVMQHTMLLYKFNWFRYIDAETTLGAEYNPEMWG